MSKKDAKRNDNLAYMESFSEPVTSICCTKCDNEDECGGDQLDAIEQFYEEGWRATEKHCYCPKCANKYLKQ